MKYTILSLLFLASITFISCSDDDCCIDVQSIHYDGANANAPELPAGIFEFAVRYPERLLASVSDKALTGVDIYMYEIPTEYTLRIYEDVGGDLGPILQTQMLTGLRSNAWNTVDLTTPLDVSDMGIWIGIEVVMDRDMQTVGCDSGPADPNGDWLYDDVDKQYLKYEQRVGTSVNWNVRALFL